MKSESSLNETINTKKGIEKCLASETLLLSMLDKRKKAAAINHLNEFIIFGQILLAADGSFKKLSNTSKDFPLVMTKSKYNFLNHNFFNNKSSIEKDFDIKKLSKLYYENYEKIFTV